MCGICGELRFDKIARRGPDHADVFSDGPLALGHRRLVALLADHVDDLQGVMPADGGDAEAVLIQITCAGVDVQALGART